MKRGLHGSDAWLSPPDEKVPPSGDGFTYVERDGEEVEVSVWFEEGFVTQARVGGKDFALTKEETQWAEENWATREPEEHHDADAFDRFGDR